VPNVKGVDVSLMTIEEATADELIDERRQFGKVILEVA
jgi:hypothetical protein